MSSVRQKKKGIRAASTTVTAQPQPASTSPKALPRPIRSPQAPTPSAAVASAVPSGAQASPPQNSSAAYSARKPKSSSKGGGNSSSPTHLIAGARGTRPTSATSGYAGVYGRPGSGGLEKSLRDTVRATLLSDVVRMDGGGNGSSGASRRGDMGDTDAWRVMVLDSRATRVISSVVGMYDIMEGHVTVVENLLKVRQPFPEMEGVYVVSPTEESVELIKRDFKSNSEALYRKVHLFFLQAVPRELMNSLKQCPALISRIKTFKEINLDYLVPELQSFHLDMGSVSGEGETDPVRHFQELYGGRGQGRVVTSVAQRLVTLCATLGEFPHIRFAADGGGRAEAVARTFQANMEAFVGNTPNWSFRGQDSRASDGGRATLLLLDRADDPLSPLMHEFTYQCLVQDLLNIKDDRVKYQAETGRGKMEKEALLNDSDSLWAEFRHAHIAKVLNDLGNRFRELVASNAGAAALVKGNGRNMSVEEMAKATRDLPEFQELSKKMSQHVRLSQDCMSKLDSQNLLKAGSLEQTMALGTDELGKSRTRKEMMEGWSVDVGEFQPGLLEMLKAHRTPEEMKLRLLGIFNATQPRATPDEKRKATSAAGLASTSVRVLEGLERLSAAGGGVRGGGAGGSGASGGTVGKKGTAFLKSFGFGGSKNAEEPDEFTHMRYNTPLKETLTKLLANDLPLEAFPSLLPLPAQAPSRKPAGHSIRKGGATQDGGSYSGARVIVFVIGGVCHSEMRAAYEAMQAHAREVIVGGTTFLPPAGFLEAVQGLA